VAVGLWRIRPGDDGGEGPPVLRGGGPGARPEVVLESPRVLPGGSLVLSWRPAEPPVDSYRVVLYDSTLFILSELAAGMDTQMVLAPEDLARYGADASLFWRVLGLRGGDEAIRSGLELLEPGG
jgi:hypothetical protein